MKLIRLKILAPFRSLNAGFEVNFIEHLQEGKFKFAPYCLIGRNGSGKSNILEALAAIFYHLECTNLKNLPTSFVYEKDDNPNGFSSDKATIDEFELEYYFPVERSVKILHQPEMVHILIKKEKEKSPQIFRVYKKITQGDLKMFY
ncbi:AAA family ATPase [Pedobacter sp. NJ-S-72]